jgi:UDP-N-acetylglucosamine 2-epimerase (non-hydrolysing)
VTVAFGTRPEALKLAPLIIELRARADTFHTQVCVTAQHRLMLDQVLQLFSIKPDFDLNLMEEGQSLAGFAARALLALDGLFRKERPDVVVVQGDATTTFAGALAGFYQGAAIAHVEGVLATSSLFPGRINHRLTTHLTDLHFAPTEGARRNLIHEGIQADKILVTGNTIVDTLQQILSRLDSGNLDTPLRERFPELPSKVILFTCTGARITEGSFWTSATRCAS